MNEKSAKRIVALLRQRAQYKAMEKSNILKADEVETLTAMVDREIAQERGQQELALDQGKKAPGTR